MMCTTTGTGEADIRESAGISCGPPANPMSRSEPKRAGMRTKATSANGTHRLDRLDRPDPVAAAERMVIWRRSGRAVS